MKSLPVKIKSIKLITTDVLQIVTTKPRRYNFLPGQATEISINQEDWRESSRPFTFTSLPGDEYLEFVIKTYVERSSVTAKLLTLKKGDELLLHEVFGAIEYKGKGVFIAGGAGITPFIPIFRFLQTRNDLAGNKLIFANKTRADIILRDEFERLLGNNFINILSDEKADGYAYGKISEDFLKAHLNSSFNNIYLCGPPPMMEALDIQLSNLGIDRNSIIQEEF
jgi:ferredoxin-NADP reductase